MKKIFPNFSDLLVFAKLHFAPQNMALWVSKDPSQSAELIYKLSFTGYQLSFWHKTQKSDFGHFSLYFGGDSFVKYKWDLAKANRSKKLGNIFFHARCGKTIARMSKQFFRVSLYCALQIFICYIWDILAHICLPFA